MRIIRFICGRVLLCSVLLSSTFFPACSSSDDEESGEQQPATATGAPFQVMVVFASGQLGDRGYADGIMKGIFSLREFNGMLRSDSIDVDYIAGFDDSDTRYTMAEWASDVENPFVEGQYQRRLLVLTEAYMLNWLPDIMSSLRPEDEVLVLKVIDDDVRLAADTLGLGGRLHGLNIPATRSARNFCTYIKKIHHLINSYGNQRCSIDLIPFYRLYSTSEVNYRDSIFEVMEEELGATSNILPTSLSDGLGHGNYSEKIEAPLLQVAYSFAQSMHEMHMIDGTTFCVVDLGAVSTGFDYYMLGQSEEPFRMLVLDGVEIWNMPYRLYINRGFDEALYLWVTEWFNEPPMEMPAMTSMPDLCSDNFSSMLDEDEDDV